MKTIERASWRYSTRDGTLPLGLPPVRPRLGPAPGSRRLLLCTCGWTTSGPALAHAEQAPAPHDLWSTWTTDPWLILSLAAFIGLYVSGFWKLVRTSRFRQRHVRRFVAFIAAIGFLFIALISPLDGLGESLFSAHMAQHTMLMLPAAFLLVVAKPLPVVLLGMPGSARHIVTKGTVRSSVIRRIGGWLVRPWTAAVVQMTVLWGWHAPVFFKAALANDGVHTLMHMSMLGSAILFWWSAVSVDFGVRNGPFSVLGPVIFTSKLSLILGMLVLLSPWPWYPEAYAGTAAAWGTTVLEDQRLAAVIMLVPGMLAYLCTTVAMLAIWLSQEGTRRPSTPPRTRRQNEGR